jgi:hypothetical protein
MQRWRVQSQQTRKQVLFHASQQHFVLSSANSIAFRMDLGTFGLEQRLGQSSALNMVSCQIGLLTMSK